MQYFQKSKNKNFLSRQSRTNKGFALYIALITMSVLVLVSFSISRIAFKEIILSGYGKESQTAFYAADTGVECALYGDIASGGDPFPFIPESDSVNGSIICADGSWAVASSRGNNSPTTTSIFTVENIDEEDGACAEVIVSKVDEDDNGSFDKVVIESSGRNICNSNNPRIERGIRVEY